MWSPAGSQALDRVVWLIGFGPGLATNPPLWVCARGHPATDPVAHPPEVSGVGRQSTNLGAGNWASGECRGCLSRVLSPGAEGGGAPEAAAAAESSLTSC